MSGYRQRIKAEYPKGCAQPAGYIAWHEWAEAQHLHGLVQMRCGRCQRFYFPQEEPSHMTCEPMQRPRWADLPANGAQKHE